MIDLTNAGKHRISLAILTAYSAVGLVLAVVRDAGGSGSIGATSSYAAVVILSWLCWRNIDRVGEVAGWLPFLALPALYAAIPWSMAWAGRQFDPIVQHWEQLVFGGQPSHTFAAAVPARWLSEILHLAYLSYYVIIYLPPLVFWLRDRMAFAEVALAFTIAMVACFAVFTVFPVAGPRYLGSSWPGDVGAIRRLVVGILERGSSRGTAFPSSHVAIALALAWSSFRRHVAFGSVLLGVTVLLGLGAVYGGFHYGTDVIAGAVVGGVGGRLAGRIRATVAPA